MLELKALLRTAHLLAPTKSIKPTSPSSIYITKQLILYSPLNYVF